jgi:hypothetical protein
MSERAEYWRRLLEAWEQSGLSQAEFCRRRGVTVGTFSWWKHRLRGPTRAVRQVRQTSAVTDQRQGRGSGYGGRIAACSGPAEFIELTLPESARPGGRSRGGGSSAAALSVPAGGYELVLPGGGELWLPANFDPVRIARLLQALAADQIGATRLAGGGGAPC